VTLLVRAKRSSDVAIHLKNQLGRHAHPSVGSR
jgi:hypothetical protein